jgi:hypothetical protein
MVWKQIDLDSNYDTWEVTKSVYMIIIFYDHKWTKNCFIKDQIMKTYG